MGNIVGAVRPLLQQHSNAPLLFLSSRWVPGDAIGFKEEKGPLIKHAVRSEPQDKYDIPNVIALCSKTVKRYTMQGEIRNLIVAWSKYLLRIIRHTCICLFSRVVLTLEHFIKMSPKLQDGTPSACQHVLLSLQILLSECWWSLPTSLAQHSPSPGAVLDGCAKLSLSTFISGPVK